MSNEKLKQVEKIQSELSTDSPIEDFVTSVKFLAECILEIETKLLIEKEQEHKTMKQLWDASSISGEFPIEEKEAGE